MRYDARALRASNAADAESTSLLPGSTGKQGGAIQKPFAVFDIDGTLIRWQLYHSLVDELGKQTMIDVADMREIKESRMNWKKRSDTFSQYQSKLVEVFHKNLQRIPPSAFDKAVDAVFDRYKDQVYTYTRDLIAQLKRDGYVLFAISGSHQEMIKKLADHYGFDDAVGNAYERTAKGFTGKHQYIVDHKPQVLEKLIDKHGVTKRGSLAIGDSGSDVSLLEMVENPIAFNPDQTLYETAAKNGWPIVIERKNVTYRLEQRDGAYQLTPTNV